MKSFLSESSIHGVKYLADGGSLVSKIAWLICLCASFATSLYFIYLNVEHWQNSPAVVTTVSRAAVWVRLLELFFTLQNLITGIF